MRKPIIAGNWKMNKTPSETLKLLQGLVKELWDIDGVDVLVCPPFTSLAPAGELLKGSAIKLGAQNMHWEEKGAYTGEISADMLLDCGCSYVILGHSERRMIFRETNEEINKKVKTALKKGLHVVLCIGEVLEERNEGKTMQVVKEQLLDSLVGLSVEEMKGVVVAYEPAWAIGTGKTATADDAEDVIKEIREIIKETWDGDIAEKTRILYGGSVKASNIKELMSQPDIDGALVGGASLKTEDFVPIVKY